ncbi:hypothetical protein NPX13_g5008 [Xylaria arbuscula]|uniref:Zn(2)-C6 fungal-type domain-containing protein n=1 Tax=Xylaria arbuscula TaxID=114810 RepID=A0A9W8NFE4_9PEZI|nr:hypothetical protein NPX13_g5008 [Xylaria arbuscula]
MAGDYRGEGHLPRRDQLDDSPYPPLLGGQDQHARAIAHHVRPQMASSAVTLPSIHDRPEMYPPPTSRPWDARLDQRDPRASAYGPSPNSGSPYAPPPGGVPAHGGYSPANSGNPYAPPGSSHQPYLPPVHAQNPDSRAHSYYPAQNPGPFSGPPNVYDYAYRQDRGPPGPYTPEYGRGPAPPGSYPPEFARAAPPSAVISHGQSAPRQRTSIACKYCRRRKIRCSGYANSPGGKCTNCIKMNQECVFQPVSSTSSTAFVPVSALPNGVVPPGMPLFGAYGQPLATGGPSNYPPTGANYQATTPHYEQPLPSPTGSNNSYWEENRAEGTRRRHRLSDEHGVRLPPPIGFPDDNTRRRSPSSTSPNRLQLLQPSHPQPIPHQGFDNRTPPPKSSPSGAAASSAPGNSVMNLENIMSSNRNEDDRKMVGRLNFRAK